MIPSRSIQFKVNSHPPKPTSWMMQIEINTHTHMERKKTIFEYTNTLDRAKKKIKFLVIEYENYIRK